MKTIEYHHQGTWYGRLFDDVNNRIAVDVDSLRTVAIAVDADGVYFPGAASNFYNGYVMARATWPPGLYVHLRLERTHRTQVGAGWKTNGRFGLTFRPWQSDAGAAAGVHGPNYGQATSWQRGTA